MMDWSHFCGKWMQTLLLLASHACVQTPVSSSESFSAFGRNRKKEKKWWHEQRKSQKVKPVLHITHYLPRKQCKFNHFFFILFYFTETIRTYNGFTLSFGNYPWTFWIILDSLKNHFWTFSCLFNFLNQFNTCIFYSSTTDTFSTSND